jgi:hypothetical protein
MPSSVGTTIVASSTDHSFRPLDLDFAEEPAVAAGAGMVAGRKTA